MKVMSPDDEHCWERWDRLDEVEIAIEGIVRENIEEMQDYLANDFITEWKVMADNKAFTQRLRTLLYRHAWLLVKGRSESALHCMQKRTLLRSLLAELVFATVASPPVTPPKLERIERVRTVMPKKPQPPPLEQQQPPPPPPDLNDARFEHLRQYLTANDDKATTLPDDVKIEIPVKGGGRRR